MGCVHSTKREIARTQSGKVYNRQIRKQRKFRSGLHVEKTGEMGAEANFQAAITTDIEEKYTRANGNHVPRIAELVSQESQTAPQLSRKVNNVEEEPSTSDKMV